MKPNSQRLNMHESTVFRIRFQGELDGNWCDYFGAQECSLGLDESGTYLTTLISEPMDQSALVGLINNLNALGLPLISVEQVI